MSEFPRWFRPYRPWICVHFLTLLLATSASGWATEIVCHRGANKHAPENTYASTQLCIDWGVDYVELDVRRSADGVMYMMHDAKVDRTTNGTGYLNQLDSSVVDGLDAGSWFSPEFVDERVPRLEPYLRWLKGRIKVYFDVKDADIAELVALVREVGMENESFFWFSDDAQAREFRRIAPELKLKINAATVEQAEAAARDFKADLVEVRLRHLTPELTEACRQHGLEIMIYEPLADREAFVRIVEIGADMVNLNDGDLFREVQRSLETSAAEAGIP